MTLEEIEKISRTQNLRSGGEFRAFITRMAHQESTEEEIDYITCALMMLPKLLAVAKAAKAFQHHCCGLNAWVGKCRECNDFGDALMVLEKE